MINLNTKIRVHRILTSIARYQNATPEDDVFVRLFDGRLGVFLGCYRNPEPQGEVIGVFVDGLGWMGHAHTIELKFKDMQEVTLPDGKQSNSLRIKMQNDEQVDLPIKGRKGNFNDALEVLRFLMRVMQDLRRNHE